MPPQIPSFPDFAPPAPEFADEFRAHVRAAGVPVSEFAFANVFAFRAAHGYRMSRLGDHLLDQRSQIRRALFFRSFVSCRPCLGRPFHRSLGQLTRGDVVIHLYEWFGI